MRRISPPQANSIAWNIWHISRTEDAGINLFLMGQPQVVDANNWLDQMRVPFRHYGTGMTPDETKALSETIDLAALRRYQQAVHERTLEVLAMVEPGLLETHTKDAELRHILIEQGVAGPHAQWLLDVYQNWPRSKVLLHFGMSHPFQHVGEITVLGTLLGRDIYQV